MLKTRQNNQAIRNALISILIFALFFGGIAAFSSSTIAYASDAVGTDDPEIYEPTAGEYIELTERTPIGDIVDTLTITYSLTATGCYMQVWTPNPVITYYEHEGRRFSLAPANVGKYIPDGFGSWLVKYTGLSNPEFDGVVVEDADWCCEFYFKNTDAAQLFGSSWLFNGRCYEPQELPNLAADLKAASAKMYHNESTLPPDPTAPEGQHFAGWYYDAGLTNPFLNGDVITEDTALYAKFEQNAYTVTYVLDYSKYASSAIEYGAQASNVAVATNKGKAFSGWYYDAELTTPYDFSKPVTQNMTLYGTRDIAAPAQAPGTNQNLDSWINVNWPWLIPISISAIAVIGAVAWRLKNEF